MSYRGSWIVCHTCLFPIRLPYLLKKSLYVEKTSSIAILLACPVCAHVDQYRMTELRAVAFRVADPFRQKKAVLYVVEVPCGIPRCHGTVKIYTVAAISISISSLLELWKYWTMHVHCRGHSFRPRRRWTWGVYGVQQNQTPTASRI